VFVCVALFVVPQQPPTADAEDDDFTCTSPQSSFAKIEGGKCIDTFYSFGPRYLYFMLNCKPASHVVIIAMTMCYHRSDLQPLRIDEDRPASLTPPKKTRK
jgi:hypothetical protein